MNIVVQKFGGTSVSSRAVREMAIEHIEEAVSAGHQVVVVVSAMGRSGEPYATDTLLSLIPEEDQVSPQDCDLLMSCGETISAVIFGAMLRGRGHEVAVLTGAQAGIRTTSDYGNARIADVDPTRMLKELEQGRVVVVTGFQGVTGDGHITTLGRGGSDTTATALGVALDAEVIDIFTDVEGIMTADPRMVEEAVRLDRVTYSEMCNFAYEGAKVIHPRAVELAMQKNIPIRVRSTYSKDVGTLVTSSAQNLEARPAQDRILTGVTHTPHLAQVKVRSIHKVVGFQPNVFRLMAKEGISLDFFNVTPAEVTFTVPQKLTERVITALDSSEYAVDLVEGVAKVAAVGAGIHGVPGVMARIVEALAEYGIDILQSADSNTTIWCLVRDEDLVKAVRAIHQKFGLHAIGGA